ncbi:hypothetical protein [Clostridium estertheticum]|uniref:hypothetical protein n=1 Tax=Clostridium estertheticum TaxID=238834 RepID=UPI001C0E54AD|nr:hypothetical protein [Clostridium estertheticum]MBU3187659.1 hypothetical protein [Clostridium estertheticum]MBX4271758.1 hypothetical protein [Clostridium estertheticum]WLC82462.1 hypothetical protein KTC98_24345 [Clostridium estertheticum]
MLENLLNPSTTIGALFIGILAGIVSGFILGFFTGKKYVMSTKGENSPIINNSKVEVKK